MIDVEVEEPGWTQHCPDIAALVTRTGRYVLDHMHGQGQVSVLLADDSTLEDLNSRFRGKASATNVLSFPAVENPENLLGDVALALGVCLSEAQSQSKSLQDHVSHLVAHGILHLLGYDHVTDDEADEMENLEREILAGLGIADPYAWSPSERGVDLP
jgi:probable rRNA maturation factor